MYKDERGRRVIPILVLPQLESEVARCPQCVELYNLALSLYEQNKQLAEERDRLHEEEMKREKAKRERAEKLIEEWKAFYRECPEVWEQIAGMCKKAVYEEKRKAWGIDAVWNAVRFDTKAGRRYGNPRLRNDFKTVYLRMIHAKLPKEVSDLFEIRHSYFDDIIEARGIAPWEEVDRE